jgi:signal transduction histidine kinase
LRAKIIALVAVYVLALGIVYGAFTISLLRREAARVEERLQQTAGLVGAELDTYIESGRRRLSTVAQLPGMTHGLRTFQEAGGEGRIPPWTTLHYLFFKSPVFTGGVFLLDRGGKVLWTEPPGVPWIGRTLRDDPTIVQAYEGGVAAVSGRRAGGALFARPHVLIATSVGDQAGDVTGVLGGIVDLTAPQITEILEPVSTREGRFVDVVDQHGQMIARSTRVAGQPRALALGQVWQSQRTLLIAGVALLVLAVAAGAPLVNGIVRALDTLTDAAKTMAGGDLSHPVDVGPRQDEIATLARSFEQMRVELARARAALEKRLGEREELIRLKESFLASISHELRTPLHAIIGYTDMLSDEPLTADGRQCLSTVRAQSEHLLSLLSEILTLSGLNTGTLPVEVSPVRVPIIIAHLTQRAKQLRRSQNVEIEWICPAGLPTVETDPLRLEELLAHLLTNAVKFTPQGRVVVRVREEPAAARLVFEVSDTGIGIASHELPHIFDEFRQVDGSLTRAYSGVGLGLTLVKKLATLLHGDVSVRSELGAGSTFAVSLPLRFADSATASAAA